MNLEGTDLHVAYSEAGVSRTVPNGGICSFPQKRGTQAPSETCEFNWKSWVPTFTSHKLSNCFLMQAGSAIEGRLYRPAILRCSKQVTNH